jgi:hypothetical protein
MRYRKGQTNNMTNKQNILSAKAEKLIADTTKAVKAATKAEVLQAEAFKAASKAARKAAPKAEAASKAAPKAAPKAAAAPKAFGIHINKTGRVCFSAIAAARIPAELAHVEVKADGKKITIQPVAKFSETSTELRWAGNRPYISATKILKATGLFDGSKSFDFEAAPINGCGFQFVMA